jgi:hypothetical protein
MSGWVIAIAYVLAYLNLLLYWSYYLFRVLGFAELPSGYQEGEFYLFVGCIIGGGLPRFVLYLRYRFDLMRMQDGSSGPSRFIWTVLSVSLSVVMQYAYWTEIA